MSISLHPYRSTPASLPTCRSCQDAPPGPVLLGIRQFNSGQWYECHETLEALWLAETGEVRELYQGIVQVAIALHHWCNGNFNGTLKLLESADTLLRRIPSPCMWVDVAHLIRQAAGMRTALLEVGEKEMAAIDPALIPRITTVSV